MGKQTKIENVKIQIVVDGTDRSFEIKGLSEKAVEPVQKFWTTDRVELGRKMFSGYLEVGRVLLKIRDGMKGASTRSIGEAYGVIFPNVDASDANLRSKCVKLAELAGNPKLEFLAWREKECPSLNAPAAVLDRWAKRDDAPKAKDEAPKAKAKDRDTETEALPKEEKVVWMLELSNALLSDYNTGKLGPEDLEPVQNIFKVLGKIVKGLEAEQNLLKKAA